MEGGLGGACMAGVCVCVCGGGGCYSDGSIVAGDSVPAPRSRTSPAASKTTSS